MADRVVVSFRGSVAARGGGPQRYLAQALDLKQRAEALGATLCAWSAQTFSFDFAPDELEEAVALAVMAAEDPGAVPDERFGAGIAQGPLDAVGEVRSMMVLSWGPPLVRAVSLARVARAGEVLIDPDLPVVRSGELLVRGSRVSLDAGVRVRGATLDVAQPWRKQAALGAARLVEPALVGRERLLEELAVPLGCIGMLEAPRGAGGTRMLAALDASWNPSRTLVIGAAGASFEPLGAVRRALARSAAREGAPSLPEHLRGALDRLLIGEGCDLWAAAELIDTWLAPAGGRFGVLLVDDAEDLDAASLEAMANAINVRGGFRMLARVSTAAALPPAFAAIPRGGVAQLGPLSPAEATELATAFAGSAISEEARARWARRGAGSPLAVREAMAEGLTSGELCWRGPIAVPRRRTVGRRPEPARHWIERRFRTLGASEATVLTALAMLGGDASVVMVDALAHTLAPEGVAKARAGPAADALALAGWVSRPEPGWMKLASRSAREAIVGMLDPAQKARWHAASSLTVEQHGGSLARGEAAWHAAEGSDSKRAASLALEAGRAAADAGLGIAAEALLAFARLHDPDLAEGVPDDTVSGSIPPPSSRSTSVEELRPAMSMPPPTTRGPSPAEPPQSRARFDTLVEDTLIARGLRASQPPEPTASGGATRFTTAPRGTLATGLVPTSPSVHVAQGVASAAGAIEVTRREPGSASGTGGSPARRAPIESADSLMTTAESPVLDGPRLAELAKEALVQGDIGTLEALIAQLRALGGYAELVERMSSFVALGRGAKSEALGRLRTAARVEQPPAHRARALLAYGVALAAAGRTDTALLETLSALARAREASDRHGEHVCARFLARLSSAAGHGGAASVWAKVARSVSAGD